MKETSIVFLGTPDFAVPILAALHESYTVSAVVTQPDRKSGRGKKLTPPPVKVAALERNILVHQPTKIKNDEFYEWLCTLKPDFLVTAAYGRILPGRILAVPRYAALNVHASLLPRYRGSAPIHRSVMAGDQETGVTIMYMDEGMDTGDMLSFATVPIEMTANTGEIHDKLAASGAKLILDAISLVLAGDAPRIPQDNSLATEAPPLLSHEERIDWCKTSEDIHNQIRGLAPWPGAYTFLNGERIKIWAGKVDIGQAKACGEVINCSKEGIKVATSDGAFLITELQPAGKKKMSTEDFLRGKALPPGVVLDKS